MTITPERIAEIKAAHEGNVKSFEYWRKKHPEQESYDVGVYLYRRLNREKSELLAALDEAQAQLAAARVALELIRGYDGEGFCGKTAKSALAEGGSDDG